MPRNRASRTAPSNSRSDGVGSYRKISICEIEATGSQESTVPLEHVDPGNVASSLGVPEQQVVAKVVTEVLASLPKR